jgi:MoaA/NifB/PqqE/SkfB family radical SAM enzyme
MIRYNSIRNVEVELSSFCNASCPLCSRNWFGYNPKDPGFTVKHLTLDEFKKIFTIEFLKQLNSMTFQGNFGDFAMNPETPDIVEYITQSAPDLEIIGFTNGGMQNVNWWKKLNKMRIYFALDGATAEIHNLYRKDTNFSKVLKNAQAFYQAGGQAIWRMIVFDHNRHQIEKCKAMAQELGFEFMCQSNTKGTGPVFNQKKIYLHSIGNWAGSRNIEQLMSHDMVLEDIDAGTVDPAQFNCVSKSTNGIYVDSTGAVFPCCYTAHAPRTWGKGRWGQAANKQLLPLIFDNSSLEKGLEQATQWFSNIPPTWELDSVKHGRLWYCEANCKKNDYIN